MKQYPTAFNQLCGPCGAEVFAYPQDEVFFASAVFAGKPCARCGASDCRPDLTSAIAEERQKAYGEADKHFLAWADKQEACE